MLGACGQLEIVRSTTPAFTQHDVDGAGNGTGAGFRGRRTQDFDALDLLGGKLLDRKTRWHALTVEQNLCVPAAQTTHADGTATTRCSTQGHAPQSFEHIALFFNLLATNDDLAGSGFAPHLCIVVAVAADLDPSEIRDALGSGLRCNGQTGADEAGHQAGLGQGKQAEVRS